MATYAYKSINAALTTTADDGVSNSILTVPSGKQHVILLCQVSNVDGANAADLSIDYYDSSATSAKAISSTIAIPADSSFNPIGGKLIMEASDELRAWASASGDLEIVVSYIEVTP